MTKVGLTVWLPCFAPVFLLGRRSRHQKALQQQLLARTRETSVSLSSTLLICHTPTVSSVGESSHRHQHYFKIGGFNHISSMTLATNVVVVSSSSSSVLFVVGIQHGALAPPTVMGAEHQWGLDAYGHVGYGQFHGKFTCHVHSATKIPW